MALFTGQRLSTAQINLPEEFDVNGTISGNSGRLKTDLNVTSTAGYVTLNGQFSNLMNPNATQYAGTARARGLQLGRIMRQPDQFGSVTGTFTFNGKGLM